MQQYETPEQRAIARACLKLIMYACRQDNIEPYAALVDQVMHAITCDDVDKTVLAYPKVLITIMGNEKQCAKLVTLIEQVKHAEKDNHKSKQRLIQFITSLV